MPASPLHDQAFWMLLTGAALLYIAARTATDAMGAGRGGSASAGRRALAHWLPIAAVAILAACWGQGELALSIILATSVGALSLATGAVTLTDFEQRRHDGPIPQHRPWLFLTPAALLVFLSGLSGHFYWWNAVVFAMEGAVVLWVWNAPDPAYETQRITPTRTHWINLALSIMLAIAGACVCLRGNLALTTEWDLASPRVLTSIALGPLLVIPMILNGNTIPAASRPDVAAGTHVGVVLLNLCLLLPIVILTWYHAGVASVPALSFPIAQWRIDTVVVLLLAIALIPIAQARWRLGPLEGFILICVYMIYVLSTLYLSISMKT